MPGTSALGKRTPGSRPDDAHYAPLTEVRGGRLMPPPSKIISRFASGHAWTGGADDLTTHLYGDRSYKLTTGGAGANQDLSSPTLTAIDMTGTYLRLAIEVDDPTKLNSVTIFLDSASLALTSGVTLSTAAGMPTTFRVGEFTFLTIPRAAFVSNPTVLTSVTKVRIRFQDKGAGNAVSVRLGAVELVPDAASVYPNGVFVMEADDGFPNHKSILRPLLDSLGVPCTLNPITSKILDGTAGITVADLRDMQDKSGWQIAAHASTAAFHGAGSATANDAAADFSAQKAWLHANGLHVGADDYSYCPGTGITGLAALPSGAMRDTIGNYWRSARTTNSQGYETVVPGDPLAFRSRLFSGNTVPQLEANIDTTAGPGGVFHYTIHDVLSGSTDGTSNGLAAQAINNLSTILTYAAGKGMVFRTRGDWLALR